MSISLEKKIVSVSKDAEVEEKRWLKPIDLEKLTGWSRSWQSKARMSSSKIRLPHKKIGQFIIYDKREIDAFIEEHTVVGV